MLIFLGDLAFTGLLSLDPQRNTSRFEAVVPVLRQASMVFANLEVPVKVDESRNPNKSFIHHALPEPTASLLPMLNIGCVSLANNHIYDCGLTGLQATIALLDEAGIAHTGAGWLPHHLEPVVVEADGLRIAFLAFVSPSTKPRTEGLPSLLLNYFDPESVASQVAAVRSVADLVVVSIHWGRDYSFYPTTGQVEAARQLAHAGAHIIMGHHPHTLQPFQQLGRTTVFYSLGGLTFGDFYQGNPPRLRALFRKTKTGLMAAYHTDTQQWRFTATRELQGNRLKLISFDYRAWSARRWRWFSFAQRWSVAALAINLREQVLDRVVEYFFGYYQHPLKRLFQWRNVSKIKKLFRKVNP